MTEAIKEARALRTDLRAEGDIKGMRIIDRLIQRLERKAKRVEGDGFAAREGK